MAKTPSKQQRAALIALIRRLSPDALVECSEFDWLAVPQEPLLPRDLKQIHFDLSRYRGHTQFATEGRKLSCDIVIPSEKTIIEYDERQHFTTPRAIALRHYPRGIALGFDVAEWINHCQIIDAKDNDPPYRDEQRAFYDSIRDLNAAANGYRMIRLRNGAVDWTGTNAEESLSKMFFTSRTKWRTRPPRLVTVCVEGEKAKQHRSIDIRLALMSEILDRIEGCWQNLDAVVFPGGFFRADRHVGYLPHDARVKALARAGLERSVAKLTTRISRSPGTLIVAGIDGPGLYDEGGDQLCVAWDDRGIVGIGRKVFPVGKGYAGDREADWLTCQAPDYSTEHRVVTLPSGHAAVLCACYDMFGVAERNGRLGIQARSIRRIVDGERQYRRDDNTDKWDSPHTFRAELTKCLDGWSNLIASKRVSVGLAAIHRFAGHSTVYWQKHGIASCSAALDGGYAVGAAHFASGLPSKASASPLAARAVPQRHLGQGVNRNPHNWAPQDSFWVGKKRALVRLYDG